MISTLYPQILLNEDEIARYHAERPDVQQLSVTGCGVTALDGLLRFAELRTLSLQGVYHTGTQPNRQDTLVDFSALPKFTLLTKLSIHNCRHFNDSAIAFVAQMPWLEILRISSFMFTVTDFTVLTKVGSLRLLDLSGYWRHSEAPGVHPMLRGRYRDDLDRQAEVIHSSLPHCEVRLQ